MASYDDLMAAARKADEAGNEADARRLLEMAVAARGKPAAEADPERGFGQIVYDNVIGDPNDGVTSYGESLGTWLNRGGESMTLGLVGDEASAAASSLITGREYAAELDRFRKNEENMSGLGRLSADLAGGLIPAFLGVGAVSAAPNLGKAAMRGMMLGGGAGTVQGFMEGEDNIGNRITSGAVGGLVGAGIGAALPVAGKIAQGAVRAGKEGISNWRASGEIADALGVNSSTARALSDTLSFDDPKAIRDYLDGAGSHAMLADASPSAAGALDAAMQTPSQATRTAHTRITDRATQANRDMAGALDSALGSAQGAISLSDDIRLGTAPARQAAYDAAYAAPIDYAATAGREIEGLLDRVPADAIRKANSLMALEGNKSRQIMAKISDDGVVTYTSMPDVRQLDYITRALNDVAEAANGQGKLGGTTALGRATSSLSRSLRDATKRAVPEYGAALDVASDAISERNAVDLGLSLLNRNTTREQVADAVKGASAAEIGAMKRGIRSQIDETLSNVRATISDHSIEPRQAMEALRQLTSPASQQKMQAVLGDAWEPLKVEIDKASRALSLRAATATNSKTFARGAANAALDDAIAPSLLRQGKPLEWAKEVASTAAGASKRAVNRANSDAKAELADLLTRQGQGGQIMDAIEAARARFQVPQNAGQKAGLIANMLGLSALPRASEGISQGLIGLFQGR